MTEHEDAELDSISVIGMAGRFPGAGDVSTFWGNLLSGVSGVRQLTEEELAALDPAVRRHPGFVPVVADVAGADQWDAPFFSFSPRVAELTDPQNRLFLECSWEALENAGYDPLGCPGVVGVVAGSAFPTYLTNNIFGHRDAMAEADHMQLAIGNDRDALSTMVAYKLNLRGPSFAVQTACSTSMLAIHLACASLLSSESDVMLAGGVAIRSPQAEGYVYEEGGIVPPDGVIRALDAGGQGSVFGNGVGVVVLKRTADALRDGDRIYAQILGSATNNDGLVRAGFAAPGLRGQSEVITEALAVASVEPDTVSYVEAHGTGTVLGDSIELDAVSQALGSRDPAAGPCVVGSVKPNISHTDRASGVLGLIKTALMLHHSRIPPQINFESPNPNLDTSGGAFRVVTEAEDWRQGAGPRRAVVNSFGMGGTNAVAVLEEAPDRATREPATGLPQVLVVSARSAEALDTATGNLRDHLRAQPEADLSDIAFTLQTGRTAFNHRRILACTDVADTVSALAVPESPRLLTREQPHRHRQVVVLVPGEELTEAELVIARACHDSEPAFRAAFAEAAGALGLSGEQGWTASGAGAVRYALGKLLRSLGVAGARFVGTGAGVAVAGCLAGTSPLTALREAAGSTDPADLADLVTDSDLVLVELGDGRLLRALAGEEQEDDGARLAVLSDSMAAGAVAPGVSLREVVGRLWLAGADPEWKAMHVARPPHRVPLPTYPFERRKVWLEPAPAGVTRPRSETRDADIGRWFYAPVWRQAPRLAPVDLAARLAEVGPWLVVAAAPADPLAEALRARLAEAGVKVRIAVDHSGEPLVVGETPGVVIHTGAVGEAGPPEQPDLRGFDQAQRHGFDSVRRLVGELSRDRGTEPPWLLVLTRGAVQLSGRDPSRPECAGLIGLARVIPQENPGLRCRIADLGSEADVDVDAVLADAIDSDATTVAYRDGHRWQQGYEPFPLPAPADGISLRQHGIYLITGGLGQVCLALAGHLARTYRAKLALLVRSPLPEEESWDRWLAGHPAEDTTSARIRGVRELREAGAQVLVLTADVADAGQVADAVAEVRDTFGTPHGVIHGAGIQAEEFFGLSHELTEEQCREHYRAKLFGLVSLAETVDLDRLDFCVTLSSLATVLGAIGHAPYAAANAAMDGLAQALFEAGHRRVLSVDWDSWPSAGEAAEFGSAESTVAKYRMSYAEGAQALERVLGAVGTVPRLVNSTGDLEPRLAAWVDPVDAQPTAGDGARHPRPPLANPFVAPENEVEARVAEVWQEVLGLTEIGVLDNFFELGGHSLMAVRMIGRVRKAVGVNVPIEGLAECPTVRELAERITMPGPVDVGADTTSSAGGV